MIIALVDDMFFASKIRTTAEHLSIAVKFVRSVGDAQSAALEEPAALVIADLQSEKIEVFDLVGKLKRDPQFEHTKFIGFYSHVFAEIKERGLAAGFDQVMPRSAFTLHLPEIVSESLKNVSG